MLKFWGDFFHVLPHVSWNAKKTENVCVQEASCVRDAVFSFNFSTLFTEKRKSSRVEATLMYVSFCLPNRIRINRLLIWRLPTKEMPFMGTTKVFFHCYMFKIPMLTSTDEIPERAASKLEKWQNVRIESELGESESLCKPEPHTRFYKNYYECFATSYSCFQKVI